MERYTVLVRGDEQSRQIEKKICEKFSVAGKIRDDQHPELVVVAGGDGTFLKAVNQYEHCLNETVFVGIKTGTLGFFTDYTYEEVDQCIEDILTRPATLVEHKMLECVVESETETKKLLALNEFRIENIIHTQILQLFINGHFFETFRGTGICISGQAGSSAYNRSLNGAVVEEGLSLLQLTEITGIHHREFRSLQAPLIMKEDSVIEVQSENLSEAFLCYDQQSQPLKQATKLTFRTSDEVARIARYRTINFFQRCQSLF